MNTIYENDRECARKIFNAAENGRFEACCSKNLSRSFLASQKEKGRNTDERCIAGVSYDYEYSTLWNACAMGEKSKNRLKDKKKKNDQGGTV